MSDSKFIGWLFSLGLFAVLTLGGFDFYIFGILSLRYAIAGTITLAMLCEFIYSVYHLYKEETKLKAAEKCICKYTERDRNK